MKKVKISFISVLCIILVLTVVFIVNNSVKAKEDNIKVSVQKFSGKSIDKIKYTENRIK